MWDASKESFSSNYCKSPFLFPSASFWVKFGNSRRYSVQNSSFDYCGNGIAGSVDIFSFYWCVCKKAYSVRLKAKPDIGETILSSYQEYKEQRLAERHFSNCSGLILTFYYIAKVQQDELSTFFFWICCLQWDWYLYVSPRTNSSKAVDLRLF